MKPIITLCGAVIALGLASIPGSSDVIRPPLSVMPGGFPDSILVTASGIYASPEGDVRIAVRRGGITEIASSRWESVGFFDGRDFQGLMRVFDDKGIPIATEYGSVRFTHQGGGTIDAVLGYPALWGRAARQEVRWLRQADSPTEKRSNPAPNETSHFAEELPEPLTKVAAVYPSGLKGSGVEGTVLVQALVGKDGLVRDTKVVKSIPQLDAAAVEAIRQWKFKPALVAGQPVSVWVAIPIRFTSQ